MALQVEISVGEFLDKWTILEIKSERIRDAQKLLNVTKELDVLKTTWAASPLSKRDISVELQKLKRVNETLWDIEDEIRKKEAKQEFDDSFVQLARSVYRFNDERAALKRELNRRLGSDLIEEKSYPDYSPPVE
jgi:hypothetical protein